MIQELLIDIFPTRCLIILIIASKLKIGVIDTKLGTLTFPSFLNFFYLDSFTSDQTDKGDLC